MERFEYHFSSNDSNIDIDFIEVTEKIVENNLKNLKHIIFEVTDACNLNCKYCGYGELYGGYDERIQTFLSFDKSKKMIDFLANIWKNLPSNSFRQECAVGFYGGEPLLNMKLIKKIIDYIQSLSILSKTFSYGMTTNALLLDKHIDYLVEKNFQLLVSLDGNEQGNSYRIDKNGQNSFNKIYDNLALVKKKYPHFFKNNVNINSVLHNRNSVEGIHQFIKKAFGITPSISPLKPYSIKDDKKEVFEKMYLNELISFNNTNQKEELEKERHLKSPSINKLFKYLVFNSSNTFFNYNQLIYRSNNRPKRFQTGTCAPFSKRLFLSVSGKILPCERIDQKYSLGYISSSGVEIDIKKIVESHNNYLQKFYQLCKNCFVNKKCEVCFYNIDDLSEDSNILCDSFMSKKDFEQYLKNLKRKLISQPDLYLRLMNEALLE